MKKRFEQILLDVLHNHLERDLLNYSNFNWGMKNATCYLQNCSAPKNYVVKPYKAPTTTDDCSAWVKCHGALNVLKHN